GRGGGADGAVGGEGAGPVGRVGVPGCSRPDATEAAADVCDLRAPHGPALPGVRLLHRRKNLAAARGLPPRQVAFLRGVSERSLPADTEAPASPFHLQLRSATVRWRHGSMGRPGLATALCCPDWLDSAPLRLLPPRFPR